MRSVRSEVGAGRTKSPGGRVRFSADAKRAAVEHARQAQAAGGRRLKSAARELGVGYETLRRWLRETKPPRLRPVQVSGPDLTATPRLVVVLPSGLRVSPVSWLQSAPPISFHCVTHCR